jgi:hypothetical protein
VEAAAVTERSLRKVCAHCGTSGEPRLGFCDHCEAPVCARCGNIQYISGERKVLHDTCLKQGDGSGFSMIRIVR